MFLKQSKLIALLPFAFFITSANAGNRTEILSPGFYKLMSGDKNLCSDFQVSKKMSSAKSINLAGKYLFETVNSTFNTKSDNDPNCKFTEQNKREDTSNKTQLTRINEEFCKGKLISKTVSIVTLQSNTIELRHEIQGAEPYTCVWKK
ncbi:MAG: hypothetical protein ACXVCY_02370 [Pseudobdellovibrionaceae bacterium]